MKYLYIILLLSAFYIPSFAQSIGIGTSNPHSSAALDVASNTKGLLIPRMTSTQRNAMSNIPDGLLVYDITLNRLYVHTDGIWRFLINSSYWQHSQTRDFVYNTTDSIGIGTSIPTEKLDVNGDVLARDNVRATSHIVVSNSATANVIQSTNSFSAGGSVFVSDNLNGETDLVVDDPAATLQFKVNGESKGYFQASGDNLRLGTYSGNSSGETIIRMNGDNVIIMDQHSNMTFLKYSGTNSHEKGQVIMGNSMRNTQNGNNNVLTVMYGRIFSDGNIGTMSPPVGTSTKVSTGIYDIDTNIAGVSANGAIVVTATNTTAARLCTGRYFGSGIFRVEVFNIQGSHVDSDFFFMINDPLN